MAGRGEQGHTLIELLTVMVIFGIVMALMSSSFSRIVSGSGQVIKSAETDIGGLIGLELLRIDLTFAGFGLPWTVDGVNYGGEANSRHIDGKPELDVSQFNDPSVEGPPRPYVLLNDKGLNGSDYLVVKGSALGWSDTARSWSYLNYSSTAPQLKPPKSEVELAPGRGDRVIVINSRIKNGFPVKELVSASENSFWLSYPVKGEDVPTKFRPRSGQDRYLVYGIAGKDDSTVSFPFNRADYYIAVPETRSAACAKNTGVLYRGAVNQASQRHWDMPILDCVADLQVVFVLDVSQGATEDKQYCNELQQINELYGETFKDEEEKRKHAAESQRRHIREVRVYVLAQEGKKDPGYIYPGRKIIVGDPRLSSYLSVWDEAKLSATFGRDWMHYRWKVYSIVAQPRNAD